MMPLRLQGFEFPLKKRLLRSFYSSGRWRDFHGLSVLDVARSKKHLGFIRTCVRLAGGAPNGAMSRVFLLASIRLILSYVKKYFKRIIPVR